MPQVSFAAHIQPLFRPVDISHMKRFGVELDDFAYMSIRTTQNVCSVRSRRTMASPLRCRQADHIGPRPSSRCSRNGRTTDTSRDLFARREVSNCARRLRPVPRLPRLSWRLACGRRLWPGIQYAGSRHEVAGIPVKR